VSLKNWKLLLGLRQEFYKGDNDDEEDSTGNLSEIVLLPRIGLVYAVTSNLSLYATYNKGFDPFEASTSFQVFDQPFKPILSELIEAGAKANFFHNKLSASLALYQLSLKNVAINANDPANPDLYVQRGEDRAKGVEAEVNGDILSNLSVNLSYAYNLTKIIKSEIHNEIGKIKENAPHNISNSWIKYTFGTGMPKKFGIALGHSQVSSRATLDDDIRLPGYLIFNAGIHYTYKHTSFAANLYHL
jgi:iron complex outermembrane recepter protein